MAEEEDDSSKTEEPSQRKLDEARKKGEIVLSREVSHWFMLLGLTLFAALLAGGLMRDLGNALAPFITKPHDLPVSNMAEVGQVLWTLLKATLLALILPFLLFLVTAVAGPLLQAGPMWAAEHLMPKLERISILGGIGRLFSKRNVLEFVKGLIKIALIAILVGWLLLPSVPTIERTSDMAIPFLLSFLRSESLHLAGGVVAAMFLIAALDYLAQRFLFMQRMRMTRTEVKDEYKQTEGDPQVKQRLRQIRMERARRRMMTAVPTADVIVTNPDHYAIALKYDPKEHAAPIVVAMGVDLIAQKIKEVARENEIPIVENPPLARALWASADLDKPIPGEFYRAVAEIISYVFKLKQGLRPQPPKPMPG